MRFFCFYLHFLSLLAPFHHSWASNVADVALYVPQYENCFWVRGKLYCNYVSFRAVNCSFYMGKYKSMPQNKVTSRNNINLITEIFVQYAAKSTLPAVVEIVSVECCAFWFGVV